MTYDEVLELIEANKDDMTLDEYRYWISECWSFDLSADEIWDACERSLNDF